MGVSSSTVIFICQQCYRPMLSHSWYTCRTCPECYAEERTRTRSYQKKSVQHNIYQLCE